LPSLRQRSQPSSSHRNAIAIIPVVIVIAERPGRRNCPSTTVPGPKLVDDLHLITSLCIVFHLPSFSTRRRSPHLHSKGTRLTPQSYLNDMSTSPPVIPPRSRLRSQAPPPLTSQSSYLLPVDEPFGDSTTPYTPALSACGSSDRGSPPPMPVSPETETVTFGRRKKSPAGLGKDPLRVRDGTQARRSSSGVYTRESSRGFHCTSR